MASPLSKITVVGKVSGTSYTTIGEEPSVEDIYNVLTNDTDNLTPGMAIVFSLDIGGLTAGTIYYILEEGFTTNTSFRVSTEIEGTPSVVSDATKKVFYTAYLEFSESTGPGIIIDNNTANQPVIDYSPYYQQFIDLASGDGLHIVGPYDYIGLISSYKALVEEGSILKPATIQKSATKDANSRISNYLEIIKSLPKLF